MSAASTRRALASAVTLIALASAASAQGGAATSVYRCKQPSGAIAYQDFPCKGGVTVDIKPDAADPAAIERLRRAQAEFDRSYAQRRAADAAQQRREAAPRPPEPLPPEVDSGYAPDEPAYLIYAPVPRKVFARRDRRVMHPVVPPKRVNPPGMHRPHKLETM